MTEWGRMRYGRGKQRLHQEVLPPVHVVVQGLLLPSEVVADMEPDFDRSEALLADMEDDEDATADQG